MVVYKVTNTSTGKAYIGATRQTISRRKAEHKYLAAKGAGAALHCAIRECGWSAFSWEILRQCESQVELDAAEKEAIAEHNSRGCGYNCTDGGRGSLGVDVSLETRQKLSRATRDRAFKKYGLKRQARLFHNRFGVPHTAETKRKIAEWNLTQRRPEQTPRKLPLALWPTIQARRAAGDSFAKIGAAYGVRKETVFYFCKRMSAEDT